MTPEQHARVQSIFLAACHQDGEERARYLEKACGDDAALRREVEELLRFHVPSGGTACFGLPDDEIAGAIAELALQTSDRIRPGTIIDGKLRIDSVLGSGGMGTVFRATQIELDRAVAVKVIRPVLTATEGAVERLRREARAVARLRHPNIVSVFDFGVSPDTGAYIVMELLEGEPLSQALVRAGRFPSSHAIGLMQQICAAVQAAHDAGVIHRDLKPQNIVIDLSRPTPHVKVLDFGVAKLLEVSTETHVEGAEITTGLPPSSTAEGTILGTPLYMSPEQAKGRVSDSRSDVYALGCILYQLLTGDPPFTGPDAWNILCKHVDKKPKAPSKREASVPAWLDGAVLRALEKSPADRYQTAAEFAEALQAARPGGDGVRAVVLEQGLESASLADTAERRRREIPNNLPASPTNFVGRSQIIDEIVAAFEATPLVTLTGPGGIGKTRLALRTANHMLAGCPDGVWFVDLTPARDLSGVLRAIAATLDVRADSDDEAASEIGGRFGGRSVLLVLDNCEHVLQACERFLTKLLPTSTRARVLATSRETLHVYGETVYPVPALDLPDMSMDAETLWRCESVRLFVDRARLVSASFVPGDDDLGAIVQVCRQLDGLPLAIELAAARIRALSVRQINERLRDRLRLLSAARGASPRHKSLRATIDWSYDMLGATDRTLFARLSIFSGGFTLEAVEAVCTGGDVDVLDVLDLLGGLVDKSLVAVRHSRREARYSLLETIREYAAEKLTLSGEAFEFRGRHREYFAEVGSTVALLLRTKDGAEAGARLSADYDNLRAAFAAFEAGTGDAARFLEFAQTMHVFFYERGYLAEGRYWLERALERAGGTAPPKSRSKALTALGVIVHDQGDLDAARGYHERAIEIDVEAGDRLGVAMSRHNIANILLITGDYAEARRYFEESFSILRVEGREHNRALSRYTLGTLELEIGNWDRARDLYAESEEIFRAAGYDYGISLVYTGKLLAALYRGEFDDLEELIGETIAVSEKIGNRHNVGFAANVRAAVARYQGRLDEASQSAAEALACFRDMGDRECSSISFLLQAKLALSRGNPDLAGDLLGESLAMRVRLGAKKGYAECMETAAAIARARGEFDRAARLFGAAAALRQRIGAGVHPADQPELDREAEAVRTALGPRAFDEGLAAGRNLSIGDALALCRERWTPGG